jgi:hypothetical protein
MCLYQSRKVSGLVYVYYGYEFDSVSTTSRLKKNKVKLVLFSFITGLVTRMTRQMPHVEQELLSRPEHLSAPPFLVGSCFSIFSFLCSTL